MSYNFKTVGSYILFVVGFALRAAAGELPHLAPVQTLDVGQCAVGDQKSAGFRVNDFATTDSGIFAIVIAGKSLSPLLVHVDLQGKCLGAVPLATPKGTHLTASQNGTVMVEANAVVEGTLRQKIIVFDGTSMRKLGSMLLPESVHPFVLADKSLYGVRRSDQAVVHLNQQPGTATVDRATNFGITLEPLGASLVAVAGASTVITFEEGAHRLTRIDLTTARTSSAIISVPELQEITSRIPTRLRPTQLEHRPGANVLARTVIGLGAADSGTVYLELSDFDPKSGPIILAIDTTGSEKGKFVFSPPSGVPFVASSEKIGYAQHKLYLLDASSGLIGVYDVSGVL